jgi:uncharacterized membrane protein
MFRCFFGKGGKTGVLTMILAGILAFAYTVGSVVCHQIPERSFHLLGVQLPVCARCTGLYLGGLTGLVGWAVWRRMSRRSAPIDPGRAVRALLVAGAPTAFTLATAFAGWWDPSNAGRALIAWPLGTAAGAVVGAVLSKDLR